MTRHAHIYAGTERHTHTHMPTSSEGNTWEGLRQTSTWPSQLSYTHTLSHYHTHTSCHLSPGFSGLINICGGFVSCLFLSRGGVCSDVLSCIFTAGSHILQRKSCFLTYLRDSGLVLRKRQLVTTTETPAQQRWSEPSRIIMDSPVVYPGVSLIQREANVSIIKKIRCSLSIFSLYRVI